jgi:hypothetical protein
MASTTMYEDLAPTAQDAADITGGTCTGICIAAWLHITVGP